MNGLGDIHGHGADLGVRHQTTGTENTTEPTELAHHVRRRDDDVNIGPAFLDLGQILVRANHVRTGILGLLLLGTARDHENTHALAGAVGQDNGATDHLVRVTGIDVQPDRAIHGLVELGLGKVIQGLQSKFETHLDVLARSAPGGAIGFSAFHGRLLRSTVMVRSWSARNSFRAP